MNGHDRTWTQSQTQTQAHPHASGWDAPHNPQDEKHRHHHHQHLPPVHPLANSNPNAIANARWQASYPHQSIPILAYDDGDSNKLSAWGSTPSSYADPTSLLHRLTHLKRTLLRRLPSLDLIFDPRRSSLSRASPLGLAISPDTIQFLLLCALWYASSALSSNTGKSILSQFRYPVTLTFVQFGFVAAYCLLLMSPLVRFTKLRKPNGAILRSTAVMGLFQVGGHIFSSMAISRIPVSTVHTIKALSPLFTVAAYALLFGVNYSPQTYFSLLPLTLGVILACSSDVSASNAMGLLCAFGSALVFVTSNIFFKKIMPGTSTGGGASTAPTSHKLDKLNLLFYSSSMAFLLMIPIWAYTDLPVLLAAASSSSASSIPPGRITHPAHPAHASGVVVPLLANVTVHFGQNVLAFVILARTSPVTYSIASLVKRVAVICIAIVWFAQGVHAVQGVGIGMTFGGLWMYNRASALESVRRGERKVRRVEREWEGVLPSVRGEVEEGAGVPVVVMPVPVVAEEVKALTSAAEAGSAKGYARPRTLSSVRHYQHGQQTDGYAHRHHAAPPPPLRGIHAHSKTYSQTHPDAHPNLRVEIVPGSAKEKIVVSPTESYPSPPASLDSPPAGSVARDPWAEYGMGQARAGVVVG